MTTENNLLSKGTIVKYETGWFRLSWVGKTKCNLKPVFGKRVLKKGVPLNEVREDAESFYAYWSTTETYQSM